jgi:general secretion pathway protein I
MPVRSLTSTRRGFTLIEVLVALGLIGLASAGIMQVLQKGIVTTVGVRERLVAGIIAENRLVEALAKPVPQQLGIRTGQTSMAGQDWQWIETQSRTSDPALIRVDVSVRIGADGPELAARSVLRGQS